MILSNKLQHASHFLILQNMVQKDLALQKAITPSR